MTERPGPRFAGCLSAQDPRSLPLSAPRLLSFVQLRIPVKGGSVWRMRHPVSPLSFLHFHRRSFAVVALAFLLQSLAWGVSAAGFSDLLESEGSKAGVHEAGCTTDAGPSNTGESAIDSHCNEGCHFWSQSQLAVTVDFFTAIAPAVVLHAEPARLALHFRTTPPFRPPRSVLPA